MYAKMVGKKYILEATFVSFVIPIIAIVWFVSYGLGPPESDSAEIQGVVFTVALFPVIFVFQLLAYWALGKSQLKRREPSLFLGAAWGAFLALPLSVLVFAIASSTGSTFWQGIFGSVFYAFLPLWLAFTAGASVQYYFLARNA